MTSKIKWGIIGPGKIANKFAEALQNVEGAELYAVASRSVEKANEFAQKHNAQRSYGSYEELVLDSSVDMVYVATPHAFHKEHTLLCLNNKKPVLCEKPLAHKYSNVKAMVEASIANNTFLMEAMWTRFLPPVNKAMELITSGHIGQVKNLTADFGFNSPFDAKGRLYDMKLGGGSLMDVGVYPLFLATVVLGEPLELKAHAVLSETGADKECTIKLNYKTAEATIFSSIVKDTKKEAVIEGSEGKLTFISPWYRQTSLILKRHDGKSQEYKFDYAGNGFEPQIVEAMNCVKENKIESKLMPHKFSLLQSKILDDICNQCGIVYP